MSKPTNPTLYARAKAIVKGRVKKWPSAYASGQLVRQYKKMGGKYKMGDGRSYPKCVPASKAAGMSKSEKKTATNRKRRTNPSGGGKKPTYART